MKHNTKLLRNEVLKCAKANYNLAETLGSILGAFEIYLFGNDKKLENALSKIISITVAQEKKLHE